MTLDKALVAAKLRRWEKYLNNYRLPMWEDIPDIGLYMEQIVTLLKGYLDYLPPELKEEQFISAATVNNYVRKKIMPEPIKKRYYRTHIAYLIMICSLKHCLSIPTLQTMIPMGLSEDELRDIYNSYAKQHSRAAVYFTNQVRLAAADIVDREETTDISTENAEDLITAAAVISGFSRLFAEKMLLLDGKTIETGGDISLDR